MAAREEFEEGMTVIHEKTGRKGIVVLDPWSVCAPEEVPVQFPDETGYLGVDWRELCLYEFLN